MYKDNREYIKALEAAGELVNINQEVDWDMEAGAIVRKVCEEKGPSPLMNKIKDYPGHRYFGAPLASYRKLAISLGMPPESSIPEIAQTYLERTNKTPIKPVLVDKDKAPCKENIFIGDKDRHA